jgi:surface protein
MNKNTELSTELYNSCWIDKKPIAPVQRPQLIQHIVFTDEKAPADVKTFDVSEAQDGGVVRWRDGKTLYFSTQRAGVKVTAPEYACCLFENCAVKSIDVTMLDVSNARTLGGMFLDCRKLKKIKGLDTWNVSNVSNMVKMFSNCAIESLDGLEDWDVSNVQSMKSMFDGCVLLSNISALKNWDVSNLENTEMMFFWCESISNIDSIEGWSNIKSKHRMFGGTYSLAHTPSWYTEEDASADFFYPVNGKNEPREEVVRRHKATVAG